MFCYFRTVNRNSGKKKCPREIIIAGGSSKFELLTKVCFQWELPASTGIRNTAVQQSGAHSWPDLLPLSSLPVRGNPGVARVLTSGQKSVACFLGSDYANSCWVSVRVGEWDRVCQLDALMC